MAKICKYLFYTLSFANKSCLTTTMSAKRSTLVTEARSARAADTMPAPSAPAHTRSIARPMGQCKCT